MNAEEAEQFVIAWLRSPDLRAPMQPSYGYGLCLPNVIRDYREEELPKTRVPGAQRAGCRISASPAGHARAGCRRAARASSPSGSRLSEISETDSHYLVMGLAGPLFALPRAGVIKGDLGRSDAA